jgi:hypothetical protein
LSSDPAIERIIKNLGIVPLIKKESKSKEREYFISARGITMVQSDPKDSSGIHPTYYFEYSKDEKSWKCTQIDHKPSNSPFEIESDLRMPNISKTEIETAFAQLKQRYKVNYTVPESAK